MESIFPYTNEGAQLTMGHVGFDFVLDNFHEKGSDHSAYAEYYYEETGVRPLMLAIGEIPVGYSLYTKYTPKYSPSGIVVGEVGKVFVDEKVRGFGLGGVVSVGTRIRLLEIGATTLRTAVSDDTGAVPHLLRQQGLHQIDNNIWQADIGDVVYAPEGAQRRFFDLFRQKIGRLEGRQSDIAVAYYS